MILERFKVPVKDQVFVSEDALRKTVTQIFEKLGLTPEDAAEERRLLFVGMTRARERLLLSYAARRTRHGPEDTTGRSSFLAAITPVPPGLTAPRRPRRPADRQLRLL